QISLGDTSQREALDMPSTRSKGRAFSPRKNFSRLALAAVLAIAALPQAAAAADRFVPAAAEAGTSIPKATIKFGMRPYADNTFYFIGMKKGWFDEVGISLQPPPCGFKVHASD